jgi:hypothetical protein
MGAGRERLMLIRKRLLAAVLVALVGCATFGPSRTEVRWHNDSSDTIWVDDATGFSRPIECGVLAPNKDKELVLLPLSWPKITTITWWKQEGPD